MRTVFWLALIGAFFCACGIVWYAMRRFKERQFAEEQRLASFMAATAARPKMVEALPATATPSPTPAAAAQMLPIGDIVATQKLLFEAARKAGEAGEPALAIQLYARLLSRYPQTVFAEPARAAVEAEKKKLAKG